MRDFFRNILREGKERGIGAAVLNPSPVQIRMTGNTGWLSMSRRGRLL
ncbi:hypothetical protein [Cribrihabitans pelagius]